MYISTLIKLLEKLIKNTSVENMREGFSKDYIMKNSYYQAKQELKRYEKELDMKAGKGMFLEDKGDDINSNNNLNLTSTYSAKRLDDMDIRDDDKIEDYLNRENSLFLANK